MDVNDVVSSISRSGIRESYRTIIRIRVPSDASPSDPKELYGEYVSDADAEFIVLCPSYQSICIYAKRS